MNFVTEESGVLVFTDDYLVCGTTLPLIGVAGCPDHAAIRQAVAQTSEAVEVLCPPEAVDHVAAALPEWEPVPAILHRLAPGAAAPLADCDGVRFLGPDEGRLLDHVPQELRDELLLPLFFRRAKRACRLLAAKHLLA